MNNSWRNLLIIGVLALTITIAWEVSQTSEGVREEFNPIINRMERTVLFPANLEAHIKSGAANLHNSTMLFNTPNPANGNTQIENTNPDSNVQNANPEVVQQ